MSHLHLVDTPAAGSCRPSPPRLGGRPNLRVIHGGEVVKATSCRAYGCAEHPIELGYCSVCFESYQRDRADDALRYQILLFMISALYDFGTNDPFVHDLLSAEFANALASRDYTEADALLAKRGES